MSFLDHLEELRARLIRVVIYFIIATVISYFFSIPLLNLIKKPVGELYFFSPVEAFWVRIKISILMGLVLIFPLILMELWKFVSPGLLKNERRGILPFLWGAPVLFYVGVFFSLYVVLPVGFRVLLSFGEGVMTPLIGANSYLGLAIILILVFGLLFEMPILMISLVQMGILDANTISNKRKEILIGILIVAAIITPSVDGITQLFLALPLYILFEISLFFAKRVKR